MTLALVAAKPICSKCKGPPTHILGGMFSKTTAPRTYFCASHARDWNLAHKFGEKAAQMR